MEFDVRPLVNQLGHPLTNPPHPNAQPMDYDLDLCLERASMPGTKEATRPTQMSICGDCRTISCDDTSYRGCGGPSDTCRCK